MARGVDQLSQVTRALVRGPAGSTSCAGILGPVPDVPRDRPALPDDSHQCPSSRGFHQRSQATHDPVEGPWGRPAVLDVSGLGQTSPDFDQLSQTIGDRVRVPTGSISSPGRIGPVPVGTRCRQGFPGFSGPVPSIRGVDQLSRVTLARVLSSAGSTCFVGHIRSLSQCPRVRLAVPGDSGPGPMDRCVDQQSRTTLSHVLRPAVSIRCPGGLGPVSEDLW